MLILRAVIIVVFGLFCELVVAQEMTVDMLAARNIVSQWNDAHTLDNIEDLLSLYASEVTFYGTVLARDNCVLKTRTLLEKKKDFNQSVNHDLVISAYSSGVVRCDFVKTVVANNKLTKYNAYLILKEVDGTYMIVGESDLITDDNLHYVPELGSKVAIKKGALVKPKEIPSTEDSKLTLIFVAGGLVIGLIGLFITFRSRKSTAYKASGSSVRKAEPLNETLPVDKYYEMGLAFEKFIVAKFSKSRNFTLLEWRSDKFHLGIFPESNRNPDLEYKYEVGNVVRTFSIECKYRSRVFTGSIILMNETKYEIYKAFHEDKMPVYIALGVGGDPEWPEELYIIPFQYLQTKMSYGELSTFLKRGAFSYDIKRDRLT